MLRYTKKWKGIKRFISITMILSIVFTCWGITPIAAQAETSGLPQDNLGVWLSADLGVAVSDTGNVTSWKN